MAFHDNPTIDDNSKRSEESVLEVKRFFTRKNGFINREENPDYGVDLDVELILENTQASSWKFAIQIKSAESVKKIQNNGQEFVCLNFKTSRLGYLCRRSPAFGIIILYDEISKLCYFDYVEEIVNRVTLIKGNEAWKVQKSVNIYLLNQTLNSETIRSIYEKFHQRHKNHELLLISHGKSYNIPVMGTIKSNDIDFNNINDVVEFLTEFGNHLVNKQEFRMLLSLIHDLPLSKVIQSNVLIYLAAITYGQVGYIIEAEYFMNRCFMIKQTFENGIIELLEYTKIRIEFLKGNINSNTFINELNYLIEKSKIPLNIINYEINIVYLQLIRSLNDNSINKSIEQQIGSIFTKIENASINEEGKNFLKLFHSDNLHIYCTNLLLKGLTKLKLQEKLGISVSMNERIEKASLIISLTNQVLTMVNDVRKYSEANDNQNLRAHALQALGKYNLDLQFNIALVSVDQIQNENNDTLSYYERSINYLLQSYNIFLALSLFKDAHQSLCFAHDMEILYYELYNRKIGIKTFDELEGILRSIESSIGLPRYNSVIKPAIEDLKKSIKPNDTSWRSIPDKEIEIFAKNILEAYELPEERLNNIVIDIKNYNYFNKMCPNKDIELLQDLSHLKSKAIAYIEPPKYILKSKLTGIETNPSTDIEHLIQQFSLIINKSRE